MIWLTTKSIKRHNDDMRKGQVLVVVMLILAVVMTVALSISSRSVTDISMTTTQDESVRALEAAEVGLERFLGGVSFPNVVTGVGGGGTVSEINADYFVPNAANLGGSDSYQPSNLIDGDVATVELPADSSSYAGIRICWGSQTSPLNPEPAIEVAIYYQDNSVVPPVVYARGKAYDPSGTRANFVSPGGGPNTCGTSPSYQYDSNVQILFVDDIGRNIKIPAGATTLFMRVRLIANGVVNPPSQPLAVQIVGAAVFPFQGGVVESVGRSGESVQRVKATVRQYDLPPVFDNALFSGGAIIKQN